MAPKREDNRKSRRAQTTIERTQYKDRPKAGGAPGAPAGGGGGSRFEFKDRSGKVHRIGSGGGSGGPHAGTHASAPGTAAPRPPAPRGGTGPSRGPRPDRPAPARDEGNTLSKAAKFDYVGEPVGGGAKARVFDRAAHVSTPVATPSRDGRGEGRGGAPSRGGFIPKGNRSRGGRDDRGGKSHHRGSSGNIGGVAHGEVTWQKAIVDKNAKGFAFLSFEKRGREDAFVNPRDAESLFHGDRVEVAVDDEGEVIDLRVLEHRFREIVGRFQPHPNGADKGGWVIYERKRAREEVWVPKPDPRARADEWVKAKLQFQQTGPFKVIAEITDVYGAELPPRADIEMVAAEYNLTERHTDAAEAEAKSFTIQVPGKDLDGRVDLRDLPLITIDGETARDFDDAVYVERKGSGYVLWVGIADVSHYVAEGTALDKEAFARGTSVYFPERAFHMLPRALSENLCSLRPDGPRLAMVAKMEFDRHGERQSTELMEAVMHSKRRATYNEIEAEFQARGKDPSWEFAAHFALYRELRRMRNERGSIDFDLPEAEIKCEPTGEVISIKLRPRLDAHRLIEEFMIAANEAVTVWALERKWPFIYRVHDEPAEEKLRKFQEQAAQVGVIFSIEKTGTSPRAMADVIKKLEGHPAQSMLNTALLRSLKQAIYSADHGGHYGLASEAYTHFTSPIRRYPDLIVHRMLRHAVRVEKGLLPKPTPDELKRMHEKNSEAAEHCSYRERLASDAERESIKLKQVRVMIPHVGDEYVATVTGMMEAGMFVSVPDPYVEGLLSRDEMTDDFYQFNETKIVFQGSRSRKVYKVGDKLDVRLIRADIDSRTIDFGLLGAEISKPRPPGGLRPDRASGSGGRGGRPGGGGGRPGGNGRGDRGPRPGARDERGGAGGGGGRPGKKFGKGKKKVRGLVDGPSSAENDSEWGKPIVRPLAAPIRGGGGGGGKPGKRGGKFGGGGGGGGSRPSGASGGKKKRRR